MFRNSQNFRTLEFLFLATLRHFFPSAFFSLLVQGDWFDMAKGDDLLGRVDTQTTEELLLNHTRLGLQLVRSHF